MGRLMGRRPDPTRSVSRAVRRLLVPGEPVLAAVHVQRPGVFRASLLAGASGAIRGAIGSTLAPRVPDDDGAREAWLTEAKEFGLARDIAEKSAYLTVVLTPGRVLLMRRSPLTLRPKEVIAAWSVLDIERIEVPRNGSRLILHKADTSLAFELPQAHKFLPDVYRELPARLAAAQEEERRRRSVID